MSNAPPRAAAEKPHASPAKSTGPAPDNPSTQAGGGTEGEAEADRIAALWDRYAETRDTDLRCRLVEHYLPLVHRVVERIGRRLPMEVDQDDLIQQGCFGLMDAIDSFEPSRQVKFETFASLRIAGAAVDYLRTIDWAPRLVRQRSRILANAKRELRQSLGREPTDQEAASHLDLGAEKFARLRRDAEVVHTVSMQAPGNAAEDDTNCLGDVIEAANTPSPDHVAMCSELKEAIGRHLSRAERLIVILYYYEKMTMREIGQTLEMSESRVSQIHSAILPRLREALQGRGVLPSAGSSR